jgi:hypothetical protein
MSTIDRSLIQRAVAAACLTLVLSSSAVAQQPIAAPKTPDFFSRYDFHLSAAALQIDDNRFSWDTHFGGDLDVFDYVVGRTSVLIDYEAMLGNQRRPFDPNQGNYTLEVSSSGRVGGTEIAAMFHHVSRHLGDREKTFAIAWNILGARVLRHEEIGKTAIDVVVDGGALVQHSNVDYRWVGDLDLSVRRQVTPRTGAFLRGSGHLIGVEPRVLSRDGQTTMLSRDAQYGGSVEVGVRLSGRDGVLELFVGGEQRIDADPIEFGPRRWGQAGFRLLRH